VVIALSIFAIETPRGPDHAGQRLLGDLGALKGAITQRGA
jgi:hypothetical protein